MIPAGPFDLDLLLPPGHLSLLWGAAGCGKSHLAMNLAALAVGAAKPGCRALWWPGYDEPGHLGDAVKHAGLEADRFGFLVLGAAGDRFAEGWVAKVEAGLAAWHSPVLVVDDAVVLGHADALELARLARHTGARVLAVAGARKGGGEPMGTTTLVAASRVVMHVTTTPPPGGGDAGGYAHHLHVRSNVAPEAWLPLEATA